MDKAQTIKSPGPSNDLSACCGLNQLGNGDAGCVVAIAGDDIALRRRLMEMGFCNGVKVQVVRRAPMGDPIEFRLRGYLLSLRDEQAQCIQIRPV